MAAPRIVLICCTLPVLVAALPAHGGQYRGPGEVAPPSSSTGSSGGTSTKPGSSGGSAPAGGGTGPASPATGGAPATSPTSGLGARPRGVLLDDDLGRWEFWWEFGKDPFLRLRDAVYADRPSAEDDHLRGTRFDLRPRTIERPTTADLDHVTEGLVAALQRAKDRDTVSGCVVALAKIGRNGPNWRLHDLFVPFLRSGDQELRETAALALGIAGRMDADSIDLLLALVRDDAAGRRASGDVAVNERTRAFAAFGCGLLLGRCRDAAQALRLVSTLSEVVASPAGHGRDLKVAAIEALAQFPPELATAAGATLRGSIVTTLGHYYLQDLGAGERLLQAHVPPAIARLLPPTDPAVARWKEVFAADLRAGVDRHDHGATNPRATSIYLAQSCALALGGLCQRWESDKDGDGPLALLLLDCYHQHRDQQTRAFALLSLARIGGERARTVLLRELQQASRALEQPWCAVALGVLHARTATPGGRAAGEADPEIAQALAATFAAARNPSAIGALAIALGLAGDPEAGEAMRKVLATNRQRDDVAGYVALGLGLLRDPRATSEVRALLQESDRRPFVLMQTTRALGLIGDQTIAEALCRALEEPDASLIRLSAIASALGQIGERRSLDPLLRMLANDKLTPLTRAFAAVALGSICDKDPLPWNSVYATNTNYRAATATLTDGSSGILDIL